MSRTRLGLFDPETEYVQKLGAYIMLNERENIEAHLYSEVEKLLLNLESLDVVLLPEALDLNIEDSRFVYLVEKKDFKKENQILKYQRTSDLLGEIERRFSITDAVANEKRCKVTCIVSPSRHELQMLYSMCLCKQKAINEKVLYVDFCFGSGFLSLFQKQDEKNLEDLFFSINDVDFSIENFIQKDQGVSFIAPAKRPELLWEVDENLFLNFLLAIENSSYENVVIGMDGFFPEYYNLLQKADEAILLGREGFLSEYCRQEFLENLILHLGEECREKITDVILPLNSVGIWESQFLLDDLFRGNLGDFVRKGLETNERFS